LLAALLDLLALLACSLEQIPSSEANRFSASQEIPRILWNTKIIYIVYTVAVIVHCWNAVTFARTVLSIDASAFGILTIFTRQELTQEEAFSLKAAKEGHCRRKQ